MDSKNIKYFGVGGLLEDALALMKKVSYESYKKPLTATTIELNQVAKLSKEQWDKIYFDTIKKYGEDSQEVKNIRDLHFSVMSGGDDLPKKYTHYTPSEPFNVYDFDHKPTSDGGFRGKGAYFETSETGTKDTYKGHPLEAYLRMNYTVDGKAVGAIPGQMDGPDFLQMLGHYKTKQEAIDHYLEEAKQKILQDIEYSKQNSLASKIKLKQEGIDPTTSKEKLNKQISDYLERMEKDLKKKIPDDFDKIDSYQDSYETVVYNAGQMKSPQAVTRDDEGNIIPLSQRDDFSNPDMRFKDGGIIKAQDGTKFLVIKDEPEFDYEEPEFNFRHLNDELEAQDLDNYLTDLYYQKRIKYGQPDKDAIQEIQRHYNLSKDQIQETFDDLYNYGLGRVLTADLEDHPIEDVIPNAQQIDDETVVLKNGGVIPKYSIGAAIKKFIGEELTNLAPKVKAEVIGDAASETAEKIVPELFQSSGASKIISKVTTEHLQKAAKATGDKRIEILANFAQQCRDKGIKLPEDFNNYVDAIFKTPVKVSSDKKIRKVGEEITAEPEVVTWKGISQERPTFEKTKNKTQTEHTGEFEDKITFKRTIPKTQEELETLGPKLDEAIESLKDMMSGKEFKLTASMMDELYLKSLGRVQNFADTVDNAKLLRKFYRQVEYPKIVSNQLRHDYVSPTTDTPEIIRFFEESRNNLDRYRQAIDQVQVSKQAPVKDAKMSPIIVHPNQQELAVYKNVDGNISFLPKQTMSKQTNPYVSLYQITIDGKPVYGIPEFNYDEHHTIPLALQEIKAYLENPNPKSRIEHVFDYQKQVKVDGSKDSFYGQFIPLPRESHIGKDGIHAYDTLSIQDLQRLKALSRTGRFKTMDDLLYYYNRLKAAQKQGTFKAGGQITYFKN